MNGWDYIVLGLCSGLTAFLVWKEWRRVDRARLLWRWIATVVVVGALACLGLPIGYWRLRTGGDAAAGRRVVDTVKGIVSVNWRRKLDRGEKLVVQGRWSGRAGKMLLIGMGSTLDSAAIGPGREAFSLTAVPAQEGRAVYRLAAVAGTDTLEAEDLPMAVSAGRPLNILLLASSPDFENRFLLNYLSKKGDAVASRTMVSRGKEEDAFVNRGAIGLSALTPALLGGFDLVIADAPALPLPATMEARVLRRQVSEKGLGLLVKVDSAGLDSMVRLMHKRPGRVLMRDSTGHVVAGAFLEGSGKLVFTSQNTSYSQLLAGESAEYAEYWSRILSLAAKRDEVVDEWSWEPALPEVGEAVEARLQTGAEMPQGILGNAVVYLEQDAYLPFYWRGKYWPESAGWQEAYRPSGDTAWWYVWPAGAWPGIGRGRTAVAGGATAPPEREWVEIAKAWFAGLFVLGLLFLWVERKMGGMNG